MSSFDRRVTPRLSVTVDDSLCIVLVTNLGERITLSNVDKLVDTLRAAQDHVVITEATNTDRMEPPK